MGDMDQPVQHVLIALGSNLGDRKAALSRACQRIAEHPEVEDLVSSSWYATPPIGGPSQDEFLNGAAIFRTTLSPLGVFSLLQDTERNLGRETVERWGPRLIDLDLLLYADKVLADDDQKLVVPHPRMAFRDFVLQPAHDVAPQLRHPVIGWTIAELWLHAQTCPPYLVFALSDEERARRLSQMVALSDETHPVPFPEFSSFSLSSEATETLWCSQIESIPEETPVRPKLVIHDGAASLSMSGPTIDVSDLSDDQAAIEIAAAIDAMRE